VRKFRGLDDDGKRLRGKKAKRTPEQQAARNARRLAKQKAEGGATEEAAAAT